jgi:hypothetical protein
MGRLGLRNQYALTIVGVNVVLFVTVSYVFLQPPHWVVGLIIAAILAYLTVGPLVFLAPLLPFRKGMLDSKSRMMSEIARRLRAELERVRAKPIMDPITKDDEETVERLRKIGAVIDELPVWPFDAGTLRTFLTAYVIPIAGGTIVPAILSVIDLLRTTSPA